MLVLTRKVGEKIRIGDDVVVTITEIHGHQVRVAVSAPREVPVHREEVYVRIADEKATKVKPHA